MQEETARAKWGFRWTPVRLVMLGIAVAAVSIIIVRLVLGLSVTNLNDQWPWGFWITFDVFLGVALAGGGYSTAFIVYIMRTDRYQSIARSAMLTSLLGYIMVVVGLFLDVGQWHQAYMPMISWGHHSVLFEVFICVSLYLIIQILEFGHIATEKMFKKRHGIFVKIFPVLLIVGIMLPTLHQSSLGELFIVMPGKVHSLWYSPIMFLFFLLTSFAVGPAMIALEARLAGRGLNHKVDMKVLNGLIKISGVILSLYFVLKLVDLLLVRDQGVALTAGTLESNLFLLELLAGVLVPIVLAFSKATSTNAGQLWFGWLVVGGVVLNRFNVTTTSLSGYMNEIAPGSSYFPAVTEIVVSMGLVCIACLLYLFVAENFTIISKHKSAANEELGQKEIPVGGETAPGDRTIGA
ncbi:MAG: polysulfide reductase NrfD [Peptococcaceae bacterium]|nr:polysulfide reductase NrfD [Peptococcaceae bacterium]